MGSKTSYSLRAAAEYAGVTKRTISRWIAQGLSSEGRLILLRSRRINGRPYVHERDLDLFLQARSEIIGYTVEDDWGDEGGPDDVAEGQEEC